MFIYNITFNIESRLSENWLKWTKQHLIPEIENTKLIFKVNIYKLLTEIDNGGTTYTLQIHFKEMESFQTFDLNYEYKERILDRHNSLFRGKFVTFTTLLEEV